MIAVHMRMLRRRSRQQPLLTAGGEEQCRVCKHLESVTKRAAAKRTSKTCSPSQPLVEVVDCKHQRMHDSGLSKNIWGAHWRQRLSMHTHWWAVCWCRQLVSNVWRRRRGPLHARRLLWRRRRRGPAPGNGLSRCRCRCVSRSLNLWLCCYCCCCCGILMSLAGRSGWPRRSC